MSPATTYFSVTRFSFSIREKRISCVHYVKQLSSNYSQKVFFSFFFFIPSRTYHRQQLFRYFGVFFFFFWNSLKPYVFLPTMSNRLVTPCHLCTRYTKREGRWNPIKDDSGTSGLVFGLSNYFQLWNALGFFFFWRCADLLEDFFNWDISLGRYLFHSLHLGLLQLLQLTNAIQKSEGKKCEFIFLGFLFDGLHASSELVDKNFQENWMI